MLAHVKFVIGTGAVALPVSTVIAQALGATTPEQIAWVLGGLLAIGSAVIVVLNIYGRVTTAMDERAKLQAQEALTNHRSEQNAHSGQVERNKAEAAAAIEAKLTGALHNAIAGAIKERAAASDANLRAQSNSFGAAMRDHSDVLKEHIHAEERKFDQIEVKLDQQHAQNVAILDVLDKMRTESSDKNPRVRLATTPTVPFTK